MPFSSGARTTSQPTDGAGNASRAFWAVSLCIITLFALAHAVYGSWPGLTRPFWQDEAKHNYSILAAPSLWSVVSSVAYMAQPALDHLLRKAFWFPLFGHQELGLRLPSLAYFLAMVISGILLAARALKDRSHPAPYAVFGALLIGIWMTNKPTEPWYSVEARHYSLVSLLSLWWFHLALARERPHPAVYWPVTFAFANSHFFALPLIAMAGFLDALEAARDGRKRDAVWAFSGTAAVGALALGVNWGAWQALTGSPPGQRPGLLAGLAGGTETLHDFVRYVRTPVTAILPWAFLLFYRRGRDSFRLLAFLLGIIVPFLVYMRLKSDYLFASRYFTPFFGVAFFTLLLSLDRGRLLLEEALGRWKAAPRAAVIARWTAVVALFFAFRVGLAGLHLARLPERLTPVRQNGSPTFLIYEAIKAENRPTLVVSECCWNDLTHRLYLEYIGKPFGKEVRLLRSRDCGVRESVVSGEIARFLRDFPGGLVYLDQTDTPDNKCGECATAKPGGTARIRRPTDRQCGWLVLDARTPANLKRAARAVQYRSLEWWYSR